MTEKLARELSVAQTKIKLDQLRLIDRQEIINNVVHARYLSGIYNQAVKNDNSDFALKFSRLPNLTIMTGVMTSSIPVVNQTTASVTPISSAVMTSGVVKTSAVTTHV